MTSRGVFIQAPCGSGKTFWIGALSNEDKKLWLDGDLLLEKEGVMNRNYFWYDPSYVLEVERIKVVFERALSKGFNILYSGNPLLIQTDLLIIPSWNKRWERLWERTKTEGYIPTKEQFQREESTYREASKTISTYWGDIPSLKVMKKALTKK